MTNSFNFVGKIIKPKNGFYEEKTFPSGWIKKQVQFIMVCGEDTQFVTITGGKWVDDTKNSVKTFTQGTSSNPSKQIEIAWNDRFDPTMIASVAHYKKYFLDLTPPDATEKKKVEFIHPCDYVDCVKKLVESSLIDQSVFKVSGTVDISYGVDKNQYYRNFNANYITLVAADTPVECTGRLEVFFNGKNSLNKEFVSENGKIETNTFVKYYDFTAKKNFFAPFVIIAHDDDENDKKIVNFLSLYNDERVYSAQFLVNYKNGAQKVSLSREEIIANMTDRQKQMIDVGLVDLEEFIAEHQKQGYGDRITETRFVKILPSSGIVDTEYTAEDLLKKPNEESRAANNSSSNNDVLSDILNGSSDTTVVPNGTSEVKDIFGDLPFSI